MFINKNIQHFFSNNKSFNIILIFFSTFFLFQLYGLIVTKNTLINSYYLIVALIAIAFTFVSYNRNLENISYLICLLFLGIILFVYGYLSYEWLLTTNNLQLYGTWPHVYWPVESFSNNVIRSSGLSRSSLIFLIPIFYMLLINHIKYIYFIPYLFLCSNIYLGQSRIVLLFFIPFVLFSVFYFLWKKPLKHKIQKFIILFIIPIIFLNLMLVVKEEIRTKEFTKKSALMS